MGTERVSISEISQLALGVFQGLEQAGVVEVAFDKRTYWSVFPEDSLAAEKPDVVVGDVSNDLHDLRQEIADPDSLLKTTSPWHALHHLHGLVGYLAAKAIAYELPDHRSAQ